jgi:4-amino-4-deoxychorismate lyase
MYLSWHEARMNSARKELFGIGKPVCLGERIKVPAEYSEGLVRCNVSYDSGIGEINYKVYIKKPVHSLKLVRSDGLDYHVKYADRSLLQSLLDRRGSCDEIIIVKNGLVTDTSMSNLIFYDGNNWFTPASPLLKGTTRERLLAEGKIIERDIRPEDLEGYQGAKLINVMRYPGEEEMITQIEKW